MQKKPILTKTHFSFYALLTARYVVAGTTERPGQTLRKVLGEAEMFQSVLSVFSNVHDQVALAVKDYGMSKYEALTWAQSCAHGCLVLHACISNHFLCSCR